MAKFGRGINTGEARQPTAAHSALVACGRAGLELVGWLLLYERPRRPAVPAAAAPMRFVVVKFPRRLQGARLQSRV